MESTDEEDNKKDKKLVFLSKTVLQKVRERPMVTGTQIANEIFELYQDFVDVSRFFEQEGIKLVPQRGIAIGYHVEDIFAQILAIMQCLRYLEWGEIADNFIFI